MSEINKTMRENQIKQASRIKKHMPAKEAISTQAARKAYIASLKDTMFTVKESDDSVNKEINNQLNNSTNAIVSVASNTALDSIDSIKQLVKKRTPNIKNTKDIRSNHRTINKAEHITGTSSTATKSTTEAAKEVAIASQKVISAKKTEELSRKSTEWIKRIVKGIIESIRNLLSGAEIATVPVALVLVIACVVTALASSAFGIFFSADSSGEGILSLQDVVLSLNNEYSQYIEDIKNSNTHDELTIEGSSATWPEVLSVYAVLTTTSTENATDVVHITEANADRIRDLFWTMNFINYDVEEITVIEQVPELDSDGQPVTDTDGNPVYTGEETTTRKLHILLDRLSAAEAAADLYFNGEQLAELNELLDFRNASLWNSILGGYISPYGGGIGTIDSNCQIIHTYLTTNMGLNRAAACGIIANIQYESNFDPHCTGDNGTSYGICQWHAERWDDMKNWCGSHSYDWQVLDGQLRYLEHDIKDLHPSIYNHISSVENTTDGAYDAGYYWCVYFEIPQDRYNKAVERGTAAQEYYWKTN